VLTDVVVGVTSLMTALCRYSREYSALLVEAGVPNQLKSCILACCKGEVSLGVAMERAKAVLYLWQVTLSFDLDLSIFGDVFPAVSAALSKLLSALQAEGANGPAVPTAERGRVFGFVTKAFDVVAEVCALVGRSEAKTSSSVTFQHVTPIIQSALEWAVLLCRVQTLEERAQESARNAALASVLRFADAYLSSAHSLRLENVRQIVGTVHVAMCAVEGKGEEGGVWATVLQCSLALRGDHKEEFSAAAWRDSCRDVLSGYCAALGALLRWLSPGESTRVWRARGMLDELARLTVRVAEGSEGSAALSASSRWLGFHSVWLFHSIVMPRAPRGGAKKQETDEEADKEQEEWLEALRQDYLVMTYTAAFATVPKLLALAKPAAAVGKVLSQVILARRYLAWLFAGAVDEKTVDSVVISAKLSLPHNFTSVAHIHGHMACLPDLRGTASASLRAELIPTVVDGDPWLWLVAPLRHGAFFPPRASPAQRPALAAGYMRLLSLLCVDKCPRAEGGVLVDLLGGLGRRAAVLRAVMEVFLASDGGCFLDTKVAAQLEPLLDAALLGKQQGHGQEQEEWVLPATESDLDSPSCRMLFGGLFPFAKDFIERFKSDSFGSLSFLRCHSVLLQTAHHSSIRELVWYETGRILLTEGVERPCVQVPAAYLFPVDQTRRVVKLYLTKMQAFISSGPHGELPDALDNPFYLILAHHVVCFLLGIASADDVAGFEGRPAATAASGRVLMLEVVSTHARATLLADLRRYACGRLGLPEALVSEQLSQAK
jgi:hypothetical protein